MRWKKVKYVLVMIEGGKFHIEITDEQPDRSLWDKIGRFYRISDQQDFTVMGQGIYAGEVDIEALHTAVAKELDMGRRLL